MSGPASAPMLGSIPACRRCHRHRRRRHRRSGRPGRAMNGVEKIYYVGPALHPQERETGFAVIDAARSAGVQHFVFSSVLHAITTDLIQHEIKRDLEEYLLSSGLEFTILQPANYMLRHRLRSAFDKGVFRLSWSLDRYQSMVDLADVTEVAAAVLTDSAQHAGATYELVAPGRYTAYDLARVISEVMGARSRPNRSTPTSFSGPPGNRRSEPIPLPDPRGPSDQRPLQQSRLRRESERTQLAARSPTDDVGTVRPAGVSRLSVAGTGTPMSTQASGRQAPNPPRRQGLR